MVPVSGSEQNTLTADQEARVKLRESFLHGINELRGESCNILTYERSLLHSTFGAWKPDGSEIVVSNLDTPSKVLVSSALLRIPDILAIEFEKPLVL